MSRFLQDSDYAVQIRSEIARIIDPVQGTPKILQAELMAIAQIKAYLSGRYDCDLIFAPLPIPEPIEPVEGEEPVTPDPVPDTRNAYIVMITIDITLYHLWSKEGANNIPKTRELRYNDALEWLQAIQKGQNVDLPPITDTTTGESVSEVRIWSKNKFESNRY